MRTLTLAALVLLCTGCTLHPTEVQKTPVRPDQAVVFDIDGTLTPRPRSIFTPREDAASAVRRFADRGYKIIYLSARVRPLQSGIPEWLAEHGFPEGSIHVPQSHADSADHAAFKTRILQRYQQNGWHFVAAYGDSSTDFEAYAAVGIDKNRVYALQRAGQPACQPGPWRQCLTSWTEHLGSLAATTGQESQIQ
ncbi:MAG: hypothetical protein Q7T32_01145 [Moraxellaceae bacterium]|nr:hypothetical protein [Moraxellaceae bacterium]